MEPVALKDRRIIEAQIGRKPRGLIGVGLRCSHGYPQLGVVSPLVEGEPFPTIYWLTCPFLQREIDRLEAGGWIGRLERRVASSSELMEGMAWAHRQYIADRLSLLKPEGREELEPRGILEDLAKKGIGGIADRRRLKCLHLHVAHALLDRNPVGEIVLEMLVRHECTREHVICSALERGGADRAIRIDR